MNASRVKTAIVLVAVVALPRYAAAAEPLALESTIALPDTAGRIDHLSIDVARRHLFVAELGNGSVDVVDLAAGKVIHRIAKLDAPQGVVYLPKTDLLAVASDGDGTVRFFGGADFAPRGVINLGDDADNMRLGPGDGQIAVGYGAGGLAILDSAGAREFLTIKLADHPEGFQVEPGADRAFVNVPDAGEIAVLDLKAAKQIARWSPPYLSANFPMTLGPSGTLAVVYRGQAKLAVFDIGKGDVAASADTCGDADDVFFDAKRERYYVSCGAGWIDVFAAQDLKRIAHTATARGARTSLFVPELDRYYVADRAGLIGSKASIRVYRPE
jgi:DNA-binding beta-propeller fold protein YncE